MQDFHISTSREETFLVSFQKPLDTCYHVQRPIEKTEEKECTRGFLHNCQPPACQGIPVATTDRSEMTQCQAKKTGEQTNAVSKILSQNDKEGEKIFSETMIIMAKQREGPSGQHLADSATLPSAVVKAPRA